MHYHLDQAMFEEAISSISLDYLQLLDCSIEVQTETQAEDGSAYIATKDFGIGATTQLGIWLTENLTGKVIIR